MEIEKNIIRTFRKPKSESSEGNSDNLPKSDSTSDKSSTASLTKRLQNLPELCLSERVAVFNRRLHWDKWKYQLYLQSQEIFNKIEEKEELEMSSSDLKSRILNNSELKDVRARKNANLTLQTLKSVHCPSSSAFKDVKERCYAEGLNYYPKVHKTSFGFSKPSSGSSSNRSFKDDKSNGSKTPTSYNRLRHQLHQSWMYNKFSSNSKKDAVTQFSKDSLLPQLKIDNISTIRNWKLNSESESDIEKDPVIPGMVMRSHEDQRNWSRSKISESSSKVDLELPCIKSRSSSSSRNSKFSTESRKELLRLNNQIASLLFQVVPVNVVDESSRRTVHHQANSDKLKDSMYLKESIKPLRLHENPTSRSSSSHCETQHDGILSSTSSSKLALRDTRFNHLNYLENLGFYTDRPKSSRKICPVHSQKVNFNTKLKMQKTMQSSCEIYIPELDIRSPSTSVDSGATYNVQSSNQKSVSIKSPKQETQHSFGLRHSNRENVNSDLRCETHKHQSSYLTSYSIITQPKNQQSTTQPVAKLNQNSKSLSKLQQSKTFSKIPVKITTNSMRIVNPSKSVADFTSLGQMETSQLSERKNNSMTFISLAAKDPVEIYNSCVEQNDREQTASIEEVKSKQNSCKEFHSREIDFNLETPENSQDKLTNANTTDSVHESSCTFNYMKDENFKNYLKNSGAEIQHNLFVEECNIENKTVKLPENVKNEVTVKEPQNFELPSLTLASDVPQLNKQNVITVSDKTDASEKSKTENIRNYNVISIIKEINKDNESAIKINDTINHEGEMVNNEKPLVDDKQFEKIQQTKERAFVLLVKSESAKDFQSKDRMDRKNFPSSSISTSKLNCLFESKKDAQDRFPFTISENTSRNSSKFRGTPDYDYSRQIISEKVYNTYDLKSSSTKRLTCVGLEPTTTKIINYVSNDRPSETQNLVPKIKLKNTKNEQDQKQFDEVEVMYKNESLISEDFDDSTNQEIPNKCKFTVRQFDNNIISSGKSVESKQNQTVISKLTEQMPQIKYDNWVQEVHSKNQYNISLESQKNEICELFPKKDSYSEFIMKKYKIDKETRKICKEKVENRNFENNHEIPEITNDIPLKKEIKKNIINEDSVNSSCLCFEWCRS